MLGLTADLPDALVRVSAVGQRLLHQSGQPLPDGVDDLGRSPLQVGVHPVEEHSPHVVLVLVPCTVSHPDRTRPVVSRKMVEGLLSQVPFAADAVHDLEFEGLVDLALADRLEDEGKVLECFPVEAQTVERAQHESSIPDPGVAVVPISGTTWRLGKGRRRSGHDGAGRRVAQALEGQGTAFDVGAPGVVGKRPAGQPVAPEGHRGVDIPVHLVPVGGSVASPHDRAMKHSSPSAKLVRP